MSRKPQPASPLLNIVNVFTVTSWVCTSHQKHCNGHFPPNILNYHQQSFYTAIFIILKTDHVLRLPS